MLNGKSIRLRMIERDDLKPMNAAFNDVAQVGAFWPARLRPLPELEKRFEDNGLWGEEQGFLAITDHSGQLLGSIGFLPFTHWSEGVEIGGITFEPSRRGQGIMTEALQLFSAFLFDSRPLSRLQLCISTGNLASRKVAEKCGFTYEGTIRKAMFVHGKRHDMMLYSLLRDECPPLAHFLA